MSGIGDIFSGPGVISSAISAVGGLLGNSMSADSAARANEFSAQQFATRYQTTVKDLEAAGLSPMLAYSQGGGSPPTGVSYTAQNPFGGVASAYQAGTTADPQASLHRASAQEANARTTLAQRTADKTVQEITNLTTDNDRVKAVITNLGQEYQNLVKQNWNLTEVGNQLRASVDLMRKQSDTQETQAALNGAMQAVQDQLAKLAGEDIKLRGNQAELAAQDVRAGGSFGEVGKTVGQLRPFLELLWNALRRR